MSKVVVLTGGVGGAKLVLGLTRVMPPEDITIIANTADDFRHLGMWVSPDIDTLLYTLSGMANRELGWGREGDSWAFMEALRSLGGQDWFKLGDGDLALHVLRSMALAEGETLSVITTRFARAWGIAAAILPMSNDPVASLVHTNEGILPFQRYFVERRCEPAARAITFSGAGSAVAAPGVIEAIGSPDTRVILIAPSNPYLSIDPILSVSGIRAALRDARAPVIAVSPIISGKSVKGPTGKLMMELGVPATPTAIAEHYAGLLDGLLLDTQDVSAPPPIAYDCTDILMTTLADRQRVATAALALADRLQKKETDNGEDRRGGRDRPARLCAREAAGSGRT